MKRGILSFAFYIFHPTIPEMIPPHGATVEGTLHYRKNHKEVHADKWRLFNNLTVSSLAVGTYLGAYDDAKDKQYEEALTLAANSGINFFDTAINYRCQRSERVIGRVLKNLFSQKKISRGEIVISTKGGFIPFDTKPVSNMDEYIEEKWVKPGILCPDDIVSSCHSLSPRYLQDQIDSSLKNLAIDTIDIYYLHNPETQLPVVGEKIFFERLKKAFQLLEENVDKGKIQFYGLATWNAFREPEGGNSHLSLEKIVALAKEVAGEAHHLRVIQLPYNLAMLEAIGLSSQSLAGKKFPALPVAYELGLSVMTSVPLLQGQILKLPPTLIRKMPGRNGSILEKALQFVISTPGLCSSMLGMSSVEHVKVNTQVLSLPNWDLTALQTMCDLMVKK